MNRNAHSNGYALLSVLMLLSLVMTLILGYFSLTMIELGTTDASLKSFVGFYAAEAGLNVRADSVRTTFQGYGRPVGASPDESGGVAACENNNDGSGDFACATYKFEDRAVVTFLEEADNSANPIVVPRGEQFQNLNGEEYHYVVYSRSLNEASRPEAVLEMHFKSRLIPLFQFAAFYDKDLEIVRSADLTLAGPIHTNGDLYVGSDNTLDVLGQVTVAGSLYRGRKEADTCMAGPTRVIDPENPRDLPACSGGRSEVLQSQLGPWHQMVKTGVSALTLPAADVLEPIAGKSYWDRADLRVMLDLNTSPAAVEVRDVDGTVDVARTVHVVGCGASSDSATLYNNREGTFVDMLEIDLQAMFNCIHATNVLGVDLDDTTDGGLLLYLGVDGPDDMGLNNYGVRVANGSELASTLVGAPAVAGLSIATDQAIYLEGDFNAVNKKPAAVLADTINVLSANWSDAVSGSPVASRAAVDTTINAAFFAGTDTTGGIEGGAGQDLGGFNGGLEDFIRLHEDWTGRTLLYRGSFVSLRNPVHANGAWATGDPFYVAPTADYGYDEDFADALLLPPLSPRFVYLKQELFVRQFEL